MPRICIAFRAAFQEADLTQESLAALLGERQPTISSWMRWREPKLDDITKIEAALGLAKGYLLRNAGYVDDTVDTRGCIEADPKLIGEHRALLLGAYETAVSLSRRRRQKPSS